jgi:hypothetical protein
MTNASNHARRPERALKLARGPGRRRSLPLRRTAATIAALLGLAVLAAGCGGSNGPGVPGGGSGKSTHHAAGSASSGGVMAQFLAYSQCMRSHGIHDFPDPSSAGGVGIELHGGPGSDLNRNNPTFKAAEQACRTLEPGGMQAPTVSAQKIAAEASWARCMRSHGLPSFPDPNGQGAFDRNKFDESSPAFQTASNACKSLKATAGPIPVANGPN